MGSAATGNCDTRRCSEIAGRMTEVDNKLAAWKMEMAKVNYVFRYYGGLMTECERLAYQHLVATGKATHGRTDVAAQAEVRTGTTRECQYFRKLLSDDPRVLLLARDGLSIFVLRTGQRILEYHPDQIVFNCCPRCGGVARTPTARQCRHCGHDWHSM